MDYSIQLFSVRDSMETDFEGTLKRVSELGYKYVEFAGFYGRTAEEVNALLAKYDLKISGTHSPFDDLINNFDETVAFHKAIGNKNYIVPAYWLRNQAEIDFFVEKAGEISKKLEAEGIKLGYHNHSGEFQMSGDGSVAYEQLIYRTDIMLELDTFWAFHGMKDPVALMDRLGDRIGVIHIKDGTVEGHGKPLGMGDAPVKAVYEKAKEMGIPMVVESETITPSGLEEARICIEYLRSIEK
ncbi:MAG: sugar phosphate isomerase/epimerase [Clostridia bacterium]|nr:sugar phosphate isomerase/epimerase [Clostridia bacterium]